MAEFIGHILKDMRESLGLSLEAISQKTHIALVYLQAIEAGDEDSLPSKIQLRGFLRLYANELGVELEDLQVSDYHLTIEKEELTPPEQNPEEDEEDEAQPISNDLVEPQAEAESGVEPESKPRVDASSSPLQLAPLEPQIEAEVSESNTSEGIFASIGNTLKHRRELLSLSIRDIHDNIHIREEYLNLLEAGMFGQLPSLVQAKGMLINYAEFLNLDTDSLLLEFTDALQMQRIEKQNGLPTRVKQSARELSPTRLRLKNFFSLDLLVITGLFIAFAIFVIWGVNRILTDGSNRTSMDDIPGVSDVLLATDTPTPYLTPEVDVTDNNEVQDEGTEEEEEEVLLFTPALNTEPINIILVARQRLWVQVTVDGQMVFQGRLLPGNAYDFSGQVEVDILTGNAGALQIFFNDQDIGSPGLMGQVASLSFTENGLVLPPPTNTPTITETPQVTPTPTPTPTDNNG